MQNRQLQTKHESLANTTTLTSISCASGNGQSGYEHSPIDVESERDGVVSAGSQVVYDSAGGATIKVVCTVRDGESKRLHRSL